MSGSLKALLRRGVGTRFVKDAGALAGAQALVAILAFLQGLVVAAKLGPEQYGVALLVMSVPTMLFSFLDARTSAAAVKFLSEFHVERSSARARAFCKLTYLVDLGIAGLTIVLVLAASRWSAEHVVHWSGAATLMVVYALAFLPRAFSGTSQSVLSVVGRFRAMAIAQLIAKVVGVAVVLGLVLSGWGVEGVVYGRMAELIVGGVLLSSLASRSIEKVWAGSWWSGNLATLRQRRREIFHYLGFTELTELAHVLGKQADMVVLGAFAGAEEAGYLGFAKRMSGPIDMIVQPLQSVLYPRLAGDWTKRDISALRNTVRKFVLGMVGPLAIAVLLAIPLVRPAVHHLFHGEYDPAILAAQLTLAGSAVWMAASWVRPLFHAVGGVRFLLLNAATTNVLLLLGFLLAARGAGATGVAWVHLLIGGVLAHGIGVAYASRLRFEGVPMSRSDESKSLRPSRLDNDGEVDLT